MTYEEARYWVNHNGATYQQESESLELINKAVDKQIALAPTQVNKCTYWRCSSCGNDVGDSKLEIQSIISTTVVVVFKSKIGLKSSIGINNMIILVCPIIWILIVAYFIYELNDWYR